MISRDFAVILRKRQRPIVETLSVLDTDVCSGSTARYPRSVSPTYREWGHPPIVPGVLRCTPVACPAYGHSDVHNNQTVLICKWVLFTTRCSWSLCHTRLLQEHSSPFPRLPPRGYPGSLHNHRGIALLSDKAIEWEEAQAVLRTAVCYCLGQHQAFPITRPALVARLGKGSRHSMQGKAILRQGVGSYSTSAAELVYTAIITIASDGTARTRTTANSHS